MNKQLYCYLRLCYSCHSYFEDNINNTKRIWDGINNLINRKKKNRKSFGSIRLDDDQPSQDPLDHANILNGNFAGYVGPRLASRIPNSNKINFNGLFVFEPVLSTEIELEFVLSQSPLILRNLLSSNVFCPPPHLPTQQVEQIWMEMSTRHLFFKFFLFVFHLFSIFQKKKKN